MFIKNIKEISVDRLFSCNKKIANYLIVFHKIPILSIVDDVFYFARTKELETALEKLPFNMEANDDW